MSCLRHVPVNKLFIPGLTETSLSSRVYLRLSGHSGFVPEFICRTDGRVVGGIAIRFCYILLHSVSKKKNVPHFQNVISIRIIWIII